MPRLRTHAALRRGHEALRRSISHRFITRGQDVGKTVDWRAQTATVQLTMLLGGVQSGSGYISIN